MLVLKAFGVAGIVLGGAVLMGACSSDAPQPHETLGSSASALQQTIETPVVTGNVTTLAGNGTRGNLDATVAANGMLNDPSAVATLSSGSLSDGTVYIADWGNNSVRRIKPDGSLDTFVKGRPNLLKNPRAEETPTASPQIPQWTISSGSWIPFERGSSPAACTNTTCGYPFEGTRWFWGGSVASAKLTQTVTDLSAYATNIAAGVQKFHFSALLRSNSEERARVTVEYMNGATVLAGGTYDSQEQANRTWTPYVDVRTAPLGTNRIRVSLITRAVTGTAADAYFDSLQLRAMPITAEPAATDRGLVGPSAIAVSPLNGDVFIGGNTISIVNSAGTTFTTVAQNGAYVPPKRVSAVSITSDGYAYFADPTDARIHVRTPTGVGYYVNVEGGSNNEPLAMAVAPLFSGHRLWVVYRGSHRVYGYDCPKSSSLAADVVCAYSQEYFGSTAGLRDDMDGTRGSEQFDYPTMVTLGLPSFGEWHPDLLVSGSRNNAIQRHSGAFTRTVAGASALGFAEGTAAQARFFGPHGVAIARDGALLVADRMNNRLRRIGCGGASVCVDSYAGYAHPAASTCAFHPTDDGVGCTLDQCQAIAIRHVPKLAGDYCSDNTVCNGQETCDAAGNCNPGAPVVIPDYSNQPCWAVSCLPANGESLTFLPAGTPCTAGDPCSAPGSCSAFGVCVPTGVPLMIGDGNPCTSDACSSTTGVSHTFLPNGTSCGAELQCNGAGVCLPTNVGSINAPALDSTAATPAGDLFDDFLSENGGGQTGYGLNVFVPEHLALVRGHVRDKDDVGIDGATITVLNHAEFGSTQTLANGEFLLVVNGGGPLTIRASKTGLLRSDREVNPIWGGTEFAQPIVLIALDATPKPVAFDTTGGTLARGTTTPASNGDGGALREPAVFFPDDVVATVTTPAGVTSAPASVNVRMTEFTTGANGEDRMPAGVADNTMYTYATEFTLEDASGNLYESATFNPPVMSYVTNFLGMTTGDVVPVGYYNRQAARWDPMPSGWVIQINASTITGVPSTDPYPITAAEATKLRSAYGVGATLWRLPVSHFSPLDFNIGVGAPACEPGVAGAAAVCAGPVGGSAIGGEDTPAKGSCKKPGCILDVERQALRETLPVVGTPFSLNYNSENTLGYGWNKTVGVNFENHPKHSKLNRYTVDFKVSGKRFAQQDLDKNTTKSFLATWDGRDQAGRPVQGTVTAVLDVGAVYLAERRGVTRFGSASSAAGFAVAMPPSLSGTRLSPDITVWSRYTKQLHVWDASALGLGGWTLSAHHAFDPVGNIIYQGDGSHRKLNGVGGLIQHVAGMGAAGYTTDGTLATSAQFEKIEGLAVGRDGAVYLSIPDDNVVRRLAFDNGAYGAVSDYAGKGNTSAVSADAADGGNGQPAVGSATGSYLNSPRGIALHDDGRLVVADHGNRRIREVGLDGRLRTLAGRGTVAATGCGTFTSGVTSARNMDLCTPKNVATGPDGSVYFLDHRSCSGCEGYVARIDPAGTVWLIAGQSGGGGLGITASLPAGTRGEQLRVNQVGIAVDRNNTLWISADWAMAAVAPGGEVRVFAMPQRALTASYDLDLALLPTGELLRPVRRDDGSGAYQLQKCSVVGACITVAGTETIQGLLTLPGEPAVGNELARIDAAAAGPDGEIFEAHQYGSSGNNGWRIFKVTSQRPPSWLKQCAHSAPSEDGSEIYCFGADGKHFSTHHGLTGGMIRSFAYDSAGLLKEVVEKGDIPSNDRKTKICRGTACTPSAPTNIIRITSPTNQLTEITVANGYATHVSGDGEVDLEHDSNGLLQAMTDANGQPHAFFYDGYGRLKKDVDAAGGYQLLSRSDDANGKYTVTHTTRLGRAESFSRQILSDGKEERLVKLSTGLQNTSTVDAGGKSTTTLADGTILTSTPARDPRWGMMAPIVSKASFQAGNNSLSSSTGRTLSLDEKTLTTVTTLTGATTRVYSSVYQDNTTTRTLTSTTPAGRVHTYTLDALGRVTRYQAPGVPASDFVINATTGRLDKVSQGTGRIVDLTYSASGSNNGFLTSVSDTHASSVTSPLKTTFLPDGDGRPLTSTRDSLLTQFGWSSSGQLSTVTPPKNQAHSLLYDTRAELQTYIPPTLGGTDERTTYRRDSDGALQDINAPGTDDIAFVTDPLSGQLTSILTADTNRSFTYYGSSGASCPAGSCAPGRPWTVTDSRSAVTTTFAWNASLPKSVAHSGATVAWTYDNDLRVTDETVTKGSSSKVVFGYDLDGLTTCASLGTCATGQAEKLTLARNAASGRLETLTLGPTLAETFAYNDYGELRSQSSTPYEVKYEDLVGVPNVFRDAMGRVQRRIERVGAGAAKTFNYTYDNQGRLWKVSGAATSEYRYDDNGNRIYAQSVSGTVGSVVGEIQYNNQDQLTRYGPYIFEYSPKGDLRHVTGPGTDSLFDYDALGSLRFVRLINGTTIDYVVDGMGRRVGKKVNGALVKQWVYGAGLGPLAELDGTGALKMRFVYASKSNVPDFVKTFPDNKLYRVFSDQLGTPRVIYDMAASTIFEATDYDEFGVKGPDSNAAFEFPFGFAGGLYDPDTKLTRFGARDYSAELGRWVSKDPILFGGGQANLYAYVGNDPVNFIDPRGLSALGDFFDGVASYGVDAGYALGHLAAGAGFLGADMQTHASRLNNILAVGIYAGVANAPADVNQRVLKELLQHKAFMSGRLGLGVVTSWGLTPGTGLSFSLLAGYGAVLQLAAQGNSRIHFWEGLYGFDVEDLCEAAAR